MTGLHLAQYRIDAELGRGGMGIVYRATDTKLERLVALKVLPAAALSSPDDRARFYREAKAAAALNHPNIAQIYQIDEAVPEGSPTDHVRPFIAMEFIEGGTIEDRIKEGPLKLGEAVRIATQTAEALKAAHAKDIVHRDIKSANIMLTLDGQAKVLDFGLAQTNASTKLTRQGSTLGTVAYMSPEQARGETVDGRTDLYSLGMVLYEMIAGRLPFGGDYEQAVVYSILNAEPEPLTALRTGVPMELERITNKLLAKDAARRYQTAADLISDLSGVDVSSTSRASQASIPVVTAGRARSTARASLIWKAAATVLLLALITVWLVKRGSVPSAEIQQFRLYTGSVMVSDQPEISSDGRYVTFNGRDTTRSRGSIHLFDFRTGRLSIPENSEQYRDAFFSPDSRWLAMRILDGGIGLVALPGGQAVRISERDMLEAWFSEEEIFVREEAGMSTILLDGKDTGRRFMPDTLQGHTRMWGPTPMLPDGKTFLASVLQKGGAEALVQVNAQTGEYRVVQEGGIKGAWYVSPGMLMYGAGDAVPYMMMVRPFDMKSGAFTGPAFPAGHTGTGFDFAMTPTGHWVNTEVWEGTPAGSLFWVDPTSGARRTVPGAATPFEGIRLSPDGTQLAYATRNERRDATVSVMNLGTGFQSSITRGINANQPRWSHDGSKIIYDAGDRWESVPNGATEPIERVEIPVGGAYSSLDAISRTGTYRAYSGSLGDAATATFSDSDVFIAKGAEALEQVELDGAQVAPEFSPHERFLSFFSFDSAKREGSANIYDLETRRIYKASPDGEEVMAYTGWSPDGKTLYWISSERTLRAVDITRSPDFRISPPRTVANVKGWFALYGFAVHPETGELLVPIAEDEQATRLRSNYLDVKLHVGAELRRLISNTP